MLATAGMTTALWRHVPVREVQLAWLTPTQRHLHAAAVRAAFLNPTQSWCGDPYPHVVWLGPQLLIEDGHHRVFAARMRHERTVRARVLIVEAGHAVEDDTPAH